VDRLIEPPPFLVVVVLEFDEALEAELAAGVRVLERESEDERQEFRISREDQADTSPNPLASSVTRKHVREQSGRWRDLPLAGES
jgi:hypothetical protein